MIFTTFQFLVFFVCVFILFFTLPKKWRLPLLLIGSYYFYMCSVPWYLTVIIGITLVDFWAGIQIEDARSRKSKRAYLMISLLSNFGLLFTLKYAGFFEQTVLNNALGLSLPILHFILPLGISFHTFQAVSYTVEVYRGRSPAERNLLIYALYVAFFPQMVAGPIERPYNLLPQFHTNRVLTLTRFQSGGRMALWGLFKKVVVADLLSSAVTTVYAHPRECSGPILALATFFFSVQIYCDFSGYSDIAIGIARMMGFDLMINFRQPYFARSVGEFWHRWHISLSTWFRDYLYIPLGGSRVPQGRYLVNIMVVFLISGLWHGANWTFAIWGALHGFYLIIGHLTARLRSRLKALLGLDRLGGLITLLQVVTTFTLVTVAWVFFRAGTVKEAFYIVSHLTSTRGFQVSDLLTMGLPRFELAIAFLMILVVAITEWCITERPRVITDLWAARPFRWALTYACVFATIFFGVFGHIEFIYFQF
jgi:D-alanyl-lipoteichoic acid acyltransferase DltB (MBOAT superfamily)